MNLSILKSWLLPALLFLVPSFNALANWQFSKLETLELAASSKWEALLHLRDGNPMIKDEDFLLSKQNFSPQQELQLTIDLHNQDPLSFACRFPARFAWISEQKNYRVTPSDFIHCSELSDYLALVPFNDLSVVYASEVLSSASSMMGHVFLKASGKNIKGNSVSHAVSFFTEFNTFNPFSIVYDGLVGGMPGFFIVRPYELEYSRYVTQENRNLFEYDLALSDEAELRIQLHIWELKEIDIEYLFQSYNCATLTLYVLSVADPSIKQHERLFVSPADVVKAASKQNLIDNTKVYLADEWAITALSNQLGSEQVAALLDLASNGDDTSSDMPLGALQKEFLFRLNRQAFGKENFSSDTVQKLKLNASFENQLSLSQEIAKNPVYSSQDSIISAEWLNRNSNNKIVLSFLPASHYQRTVDTQFFNDSELNIGAASVSVDTNTSTLRLEHFNLYSVTSYTPNTSILPRLSGHFYLGYKQERDQYLETKGFLQMQGALGQSYRLHRDVLAYILGEVSVGLRRADRLLSAESVTGLTINTAFDSKARLEHRMIFSNLDKHIQHKLRFELSTKLTNDLSLFASTEYWDNQSTNDTEFRLGIDFHF